jgi:putative FmdB family regulatory protein
MPLFEFVCNNCKELFETLILEGASKIECPKCKSVDIIKQFSVFSAKSQNNSCFASDFCQNIESNKHKCCSRCCPH